MAWGKKARTKTTIVRTVVTRLEMLARPQQKTKIAIPDECALLRAKNPPLHFYRYLYHRVGDPWLWVSRRNMEDEELAAIIHHDQVEIYILYHQGTPAGFAEIDLRKTGAGDLTFLGLIQEKIGRGLGKFLLHETIELAWDKEIKRLTIETCTLDHPNALPLYQQAGFNPYARDHCRVEVERSQLDCRASTIR